MTSGEPMRIVSASIATGVMAQVAEQPPVPETSSDWPERIDVLAFVQREGDHWSALSLEYDVAGMGDSDQAAIDNMLELLADYLNLCRDEGARFADAMRPVPAHVQARLLARAALSMLRSKFAARRAHVTLPLDGNARFAG